MSDNRSVETIGNKLLNHYIHSIYAHWKLIGIVAVFTFVVSVLWVLLVPLYAYRAQTALIVTSINLQSDGLGAFVARPLDPNVYRDLLVSPNIVGLVREELIESGAFPEGKEPDFFDFNSTLSAETTVIDPTTRPQNFAPIIVLTAEAETEELATTIVEKWSELAVRHSQNTNRLRVATSARLLGEEEISAKGTLEQALHELEQEQAGFPLDILNIKLTHYASTVAAMEDQLVASERELNTDRARLASLTKELESQDPLIEMVRAPDDSTYWLLEAGGQDSMDDIQTKLMRSQSLNPSYWGIKTARANAGVTLASTEANLETLNGQVKIWRVKLENLQALVSEHTHIQATLRITEENARRLYNEVARANQLSSVSLKLSATALDDGTSTVGLNTLSDQIYAIEARGIVGKKARVLIVTFLVCGLVTVCLAIGDFQKTLSADQT